MYILRYILHHSLHYLIFTYLLLNGGCRIFFVYITPTFLLYFPFLLIHLLISLNFFEVYYTSSKQHIYSEWSNIEPICANITQIKKQNIHAYIVLPHNTTYFLL